MITETERNELIALLEPYEHVPYTLKPDYRTFKAVSVPRETFNRIYQLAAKLNPARATKSNKLSKIGFKCERYLLTTNNTTWWDLVVVLVKGIWRIQMRFEAFQDNSKPLYGAQAFSKFRNKCLSEGIDLNTYAITNGAEVKTTIPKYKIELLGTKKRIYLHAHHIDFHNSFPAGLVNTHPEFKPVVEYFYKGRKTNPEYKAVLNLTVGYMQSINCCNAKWAHLSRDAIKDNNDRIDELSKRLKDAGYIILAYNTDGIWYVGDSDSPSPPYHGEGEGAELGMWENDHTDCMIRFKSKGAYEYIENGVYTPVIRGRTKLDEKCDRSQWTWGDIFNEEAIVHTYVFIPGQGIIEMEEY